MGLFIVRTICFGLILLFYLHCGSLDDASLGGGGSGGVKLTINNPDSNASGTAKAVDISDGTPVSKALPASADVTECTITASGPASVSKTVAIPSGSSKVETTLDLTTGSGYTITVECLDSACTNNNVGCGYKGSTSGLTIAGNDSISISALFLNLAPRDSGDARYCRFRQDNSTQAQIECSFDGILTDNQKSTAQCNIEIDTTLKGTSPTSVDASQSNGLVSGTKGRPYFILGPGLTPTCYEYNTNDGKILRGTGSWTTNSDNNSMMKCTFGVRQAETLASGRKARFAAACTKNGSNYVAIPTSGMAEFSVSGGGDSDIASLIANGSTCATSRSGETCSSGLCVANSTCAAVPAVSLANDAADSAGTACPGGVCAAGTANGSSTDARFDTPRGGCLSPNGNSFYVMDTANHTVRTMDLTVSPTSGSHIVTLAGTAGASGSTDDTGSNARFNQPFACVVNSANDAIFVSDSVNSTIRKVTPLGVVTTLAGSAGVTGLVNGTGSAARFNGPQGIDIDASDTLYVADGSNDAVRKITSTGVVTSVATGLDAVFDVVLDPTETFLYVTVANDATLRKINIPTGAVTTIATGLTSIAGIDIDPTNTNLYLTVGNTIQKFVISSSTVTTIAGASGSGSSNGNGTSATFSSPSDIISNPAGGIYYILDTSNHKIRNIQ